MREVCLRCCAAGLCKTLWGCGRDMSVCVLGQPGLSQMCTYAGPLGALDRYRRNPPQGSMAKTRECLCWGRQERAKRARGAAGSQLGALAGL